jgi:hypothetical protein
MMYMRPCDLECGLLIGHGTTSNNYMFVGCSDIVFYYFVMYRGNLCTDTDMVKFVHIHTS